MKSIYIIFFSTDLKTGMLIRKITRHKYNHVSISLDGMKTLYSFSRLYYNHPMIGGFVEESPLRYLSSDKNLVKTVKIDVDDNTYAMALHRIRRMERRPDEYVYNYLSIASYLTGRRIRRDKSYTCAEFVRDTLAVLGIVLTDRRSRISIARLEEELSGYETREGTAGEIFDCETWGNDRYLEDFGGRLRVAREAIRRFKSMILNC